MSCLHLHIDIYFHLSTETEILCGEICGDNSGLRVRKCIRPEWNWAVTNTTVTQTPHTTYTTGSYSTSSLGLLGREAMFDYVETGRGSEEEEDEDTT